MEGKKMAHVLVVTFAGQGHINPFLRLAKRLASKGFFVTFATLESVGEKMRKAGDREAANLPIDAPTAVGQGLLRFEFFSDGWSDLHGRQDPGTSFLQLQKIGPQELADLIDRQAEAGRPVSFAITNPFIPWALDAAADAGIKCAVFWVQSCAVFSIYYHHFHSKSINLCHPLLYKLDSCRNMPQFNQIHALIITSGMYHDAFAASYLLKFSACTLNPPNISLSVLIFYNIQCPDVFSYNLMIKGYSQSAASPLTSISFYQTLLHQGLHPNEYTLCFLLASCAKALGLKEGTQIHGHIIKLGLGSTIFVITSLIHMYGECGSINDSCRAFDEMTCRSEVSWNVMLAAFITCGYLTNAVLLFGEMRDRGVEASNATLVSTLSACAKLGDLFLGRMVHAHAATTGMELTVTLGTSLIDMYAKCGAIDVAVDVFREMPTKNVATWNSMIHGLATNCHGHMAVGLFREMEVAGFPPNGITFIGVLHGCSHAGLVDNGLMYFSSMNKIYGVEPNIKHYGCLVDLLGRAGRLHEALDVIRAMPMQPDVVIWGALFGACRIHGNTRLGELVAAQVMKLQSQSTCGYVLLSEMYAMSDRWEDVVGVRNTLMEVDTRKMPGWSSVACD